MPDILPASPPDVNAGSGLAGFDVDAASRSLAAVGQPPAAPPVPDVAPLQGPPVPPGTLVSDTPPAGVSGRVSDKSTPIPSDPQEIAKQAVGDQAKATRDEAVAADAAARAEQEKREADAKEAEAAAAEIRKRQEDRDRQQQANDQARARLLELADKADADVGHFKFTDYGDTIPGTRKAALIIGAALSGMGGATDPLASINKLIAHHFETQRAELSSKEAFARAKRQGVEDFDKHVNDQRLESEFQERNYREAIAKEIEARGLRSGNPLALARAQQMAAKVRAEGDAKLVGTADAYIRSETDRAHAELLRSKARGGGKGGGGARIGEDDLAAAAQNGASYADLVKMAVKLKAAGKLGPKDDPRKVAKDVMEGAEKDTQTIVYVNGEPTGRASSARNVKAIEDRAVQFDDAIESLEQLKKNLQENPIRGRIPAGDVFNRAALAVAATTTANSSDHTTHMETGTLQNWGMVSTEAVDRTLGHLRERQKKFMGQLTPMPGRSGAGGGGEAQPETKVVNGHTYAKIKGGWQLQE